MDTETGRLDDHAEAGDGFSLFCHLSLDGLGVGVTGGGGGGDQNPPGVFGRGGWGVVGGGGCGAIQKRQGTGGITVGVGL
jgi:hypothetical protein